MITIDGGTGVIRRNGVEIASEKMVDYWYLNADITSSDGDADIPGSKFTRNDKVGGASQIGTGMTVDNSSGVWTFPTTGKYMIHIHMHNRAVNTDNMYMLLESTTDNSTYVGCQRTQSSSSGADGNSHSGSGEYFVNVTDTSQVKVRFKPQSVASSSGGSYWEGYSSATYLLSTVTFTRLSR